MERLGVPSRHRGSPRLHEHQWWPGPHFPFHRFGTNRASTWRRLRDSLQPVRSVRRSRHGDSPVQRACRLQLATGTPAVPATIPSGCTTPVAGIGVAGVSLFVACAAPTGGPSTIRQLDKASGNLVRSFTLPAGVTMVDPAGVPDDPASFGLQASMKDVLWTKDAVFSSSTTFGQLIGLEMAAGTSGQTSGPPLAFPAACDQVTGSAPDADGDGLLDCWENGSFWSDGLPGISVDGLYATNRSTAFRGVTLCVDMNGNGAFDAGECASPNHKDIFVEADFMQFHRPDPVAISNVATAFGNAPVTNPDGTTGIRLHVQIDDQLTTDGTVTGPPLHTTNTALVPCTPLPAAGDANYDALKATWFGTAAERAAPNAAQRLNAKRYAYHYALFVHNQTGSGSSGCAEILGNDLMVSLGGFAQVPLGGHNVGTTDQQGGTFMHELGHNLNLRHGGFENVNCKPNYTSRMNYAYQFSSPVNPFPLDYSRQTLLTLVELGLAESAGIGGYTGNIAFGPPTGIPAKPKVASGAGAINWNLNGTTDAGVIRDLNMFNIAGCPASPGETLVGFNDWENIKFNFRASLDFGDGAHAFETPEISVDEARAISVDTDGDGIVDFDDNCPLTRNPSQNADACTVVIKTVLIPRETARREDLDDDFRPFIVAVIFSNATRDATMLDLASIHLTGAAAQGSGIWSRDVFQFFGHFLCGRFDVNRDGRADLVCVFKAGARLLPVGVSNVVLDAMTLGGEAVRGRDSITVRPMDRY
ncbi:MAG: hypothetical protein DME15_00025 [Candidatus Rokuibacteriota bacterium]|nr:MAG: hypothetical protein DME15_00025 [Candidatus Rokubacteria bacterium]